MNLRLLNCGPNVPHVNVAVPQVNAVGIAPWGLINGYSQ